MIYAEKVSGFLGLAELMKPLGLSDKNANILVEYLDLNNIRRDSLLDKAELNTPYGRANNWADKSEFNKAVKREIVKENNDELTDRFINFLWAAFGAACCLYTEEFGVRYGNDKLEKLLTKALTPRFGRERAEKCAYAAKCVYCYFNIRSITKDRSPEQLADAADIILPANEWVAMSVYALALEGTPLPESGGGFFKKLLSAPKTDSLTDRICRAVDGYDPSELKQGDDINYMLALGEAALFSDRLRKKFLARMQSKDSAEICSIAKASCNFGCPRVIDAIDNEPAFCSEEYIIFLSTAAIPGDSASRHLERMAREHTSAFNQAIRRNGDVKAAVRMAETLKKIGLPSPDPAQAMREKAEEFLNKVFKNDCEDIINYVRGNAALNDILPEIKGKQTARLCNQDFDYYGAFGADEFFVRYFTVFMLSHIDYAKATMVNSLTGLDYYKKTDEAVKVLFSSGLSANEVLAAAADYIECMYSFSDDCISKTAACAAKYPAELDTLTTDGLSASARMIAVKAFAVSPNRYKKQLLNMSDDGSKAVRAQLANILADRKNWSGDIAEMLAAKKSAKRELALNIIERQGAEAYTDALQAAFEKERSAKLKDRMAVLLGAPTSSEQGGGTAVDIAEQLTKGGKAKKVAWVFDGSTTPVHYRDGSDTERKYLEALLLCYAGMTDPGVNTTADALAEKLGERELQAFAREVFGKWIDSGAAAKTKWVLYFAAMRGGDGIVGDILHYIKYWCEHSRSAIAAEAVKALALSGSSAALMEVDGMSRKFKNKAVRAAAGQAMRNAAEQLGLTTDQLADKIVPDLGFDENNCRVFDYGSRQFKVYLGPGGTLEIYNGDKKIKNLPKPGANDDAEKAAAASADFKEMKKQLKTTAANQQARLESVLMNERKWSADGWRQLFVKNAVMHGFAIGLIWGIYDEKGTLTQTFRYTEEGSFNTSDDEELELPENVQIGLVHPLELTPEQLNEWTSQLEDYEIEQPFAQLARKIYTMTDEERNSDSITRFKDTSINSLSLIGKMTKSGWYKGAAEDAGWFYYFYREDISSRTKQPDGTYLTDGLTAVLNFSGASIAAYDFEGEEVTIEDLKIYRAGADLYKDKPLNLSEVSGRYFSELVMQLSAYLGSGGEQ